MSWQAYIDDHLMVPLIQDTSLESAAIIGFDGGIWAKSEKFPEPGQDEIELIVAALDDCTSQNDGTFVPGPKYVKLQEDGVIIAGQKYLVIRGDAGVLRGRHEKLGFVIKKTGQALVCGFYDGNIEGMAGSASVIVEQMGDYLTAQDM